MSIEERFTRQLGFEIVRDGPEPLVRVVVADKHRNGNGVVHGSVYHALLDTVMGVVAFRELGRTPIATAEISVRFLRPVREGTLEARARVLKIGKRLVFLDGDVRQEGALVAVGQGTFVPIGKP